jgi:choline dehydrogenase-like flavoprotein
MKIIDFHELENELLLQVDLCIVGTGPIGLSIANEFAGLDWNVLVLEGGGMTEEPDTQSLYDIEPTGEPIPMDQSRRYRLRAFGGTSRIWTGRCAPFEDDDFEPRSWVRYSGWPFSRRELDPYYERAGTYLGLGPHCYDDSLWSRFEVPRPSPSLDERLIEPFFWQFSRSPTSSQAVDFGKDLKFPNSPNLKVLLHANVTNINVSAEANRFDSVDIRTLHGKQGRIRARALVLGCGGIENARLLLASNRQVPMGLGNQNDLVGRFLMDHPLCIVGRFHPKEGSRVLNRFGHYWLDSGEKRHSYLHGMALSREIQRKEHLLKCHAFVDAIDPVTDDPWIALRRWRSTLKSGRLHQAAMQDGRIILSHALELTQGAFRRLVKHRPQLPRTERTELHCILEQMPDPESRVTLSGDRKDALGVPISKVHWKIGDVEVRTVRRMSQLVCQEFGRLKLPLPAFCPWFDASNAEEPRFENKAHPTGTTRLAPEPRHGVVDVNLQVHNVHGLFVAGTSVFPTSGAVNPTLMAVALALRLADWLKTSYFSR